MGADDDEDVFVPLRPLLPHDAGRGDRRGDRPGSRRVRGLSRADIIDVAIAVADAEGADAVSMRRIAHEMHVGAMSLYWHIASKEELHRLMLEWVQAEVEVPEPTGDWRGDLRSYAHSTRAVLLRHPWAIDFLGSGPPSGPNDARNAERLLAALDELGLDLATTMMVAMSVGTYVIGAALREVQEIRSQHAAEAAAANLPPEEVAAALAEFGRRIRRSGRYPHIAAALDAGLDPDSPDTRTRRFDFGLDRMLDGIEARVKADRSGA
ncbi:MAG TPA: TetR/AcrR family transcriptional regulator [Trebonia sp.]|jgi:AcrR family transcriptional regulator|nr:TetR/AcrR family transcriptional regulator [Trebonia sp.]